MSAIFCGFARQTVPTSTLKVGDYMYVPGLGMLSPIAKVDRTDAGTALHFRGEIGGRGRWFKMRRATAGMSTIHVRDS